MSLTVILRNNFISWMVHHGFFRQKILGEFGEVRLSGLGVAMSSLVTVAEILKSRGLVTEKKIITSLEELDSDDGSGYVFVSQSNSLLITVFLCFADAVASCRKRKKPKLEIILEKTANFEELVAKEAAERAAKRSNAAKDENVE